MDDYDYSRGHRPGDHEEHREPSMLKIAGGVFLGGMMLRHWKGMLLLALLLPFLLLLMLAAAVGGGSQTSQTAEKQDTRAKAVQVEKNKARK
jgi:predicted metalloprotease